MLLFIILLIRIYSEDNGCDLHGHLSAPGPEDYPQPMNIIPVEKFGLCLQNSRDNLSAAV